MSFADLFLIALVLGTVAALVMGIVAAVAAQWRTLRVVLGTLAAVWSAYLGIGTLLALTAPQRIVGMREDRCFDEICYAVAGFYRRSMIDGPNPASAHGMFYVVDVRISSRSRGRSQREAGRKSVLVDQAGRNYEISPEGTRAIESGGGLSRLDVRLEPGQVVFATLVFDVPQSVTNPGLVFASSLFDPGVIEVPSDRHFLHRPTIVRLQ